ncbi:MAG: hypothetical protein HQL03_11525 [Nitrospirae bacterium]|nr:hypothetical protein [Nitrospirota bacterium]MBF0592894.1 hypothetical protein [Nitrospirota bacterium]
MTNEPKLSEELQKMSKEYEPLQPVEKQLIGWSLGIGVTLLFFFYWLSTSFFPTH